jgi:hypothetical protein
VPINAQYLSALNKLFKTKSIALLDDLRRALRTQSRTTIFRILSAAGYCTSYSHAGRYYTLKRIPRFDSRGIWIHGGVGFSVHGTLRAAVENLVETSPAGQTHGELQDVLQLRVHDTLRLLVNAGNLSRRELENTYLYLSPGAARAEAQWARRQQLARAAPAEPEPSQIIEVLLDRIRHPQDDSVAVCRRLRAAGHTVTPGHVETIMDRYGLKKTLPARSPRSRR